MIPSFKALSVLLGYPTAELQAAVPRIWQVLHDDAVLSPNAIILLDPLMVRIEAGDLYDLQETYVLLFDRSRTLSLNLFEHIHGESRDRGGAMVDLLDTYRAGGFDLVGPELPDHLPVLLEFLATRQLDEARAILADAGHILVALADRLARRDSDYAPVLAALAQVASATPDTAEAQALLAEALDDPEDLAALDETYAEAQVMFGPDPNAGCPVGRDILARMDIPPPTNRAPAAAHGRT